MTGLRLNRRAHLVRLWSGVRLVMAAVLIYFARPLLGAAALWEYNKLLTAVDTTEQLESVPDVEDGRKTMSGRGR